MKVSVIMPVYNAAAVLQRSLDSLRSQSFRDFEVVFVDDGSTDGSVAMLNEFSESSGIPCKVVVRDENGGVASARNCGLDNAEGEYVAWLDSDDVLASDALETAVSGGAGADIIGWDWTLGFSRNGRYMRQADYEAPLDALKALMGGTMRWNLWLFMVKRSLIESSGIRFLEGADMGEDMMFMLRAFMAAGDVARIHSSLYSYNAVNGSSISRQFNEKRRAEVSMNVRAVEDALSSSGFLQELADYVHYLKLYIKLPLLFSEDGSDFDIWYSWFSGSNPYAFTNRALPFRTRLVQWMAARRMKTAVRLYYLFVYKFVYGILYR